jgi:alkanesulfonate monooxygenase SsuD/methylene tetrahydromethanopterin reductase-like flavin-dependent oxidoreductase (luciferase family)
MSVLAFASDDASSIRDFEAAWTLTIRNIRQGKREPLPPEKVAEFAASAEFEATRNVDGRMVTGSPVEVVKRLEELKEDAQADEIVVVTPSLDRARRRASFAAIADAWRAPEG